MKKIINILAKVCTIICGVASVMWVLRMFGVFGSFHEDYLNRVGGCIIMFIVFLIISIATKKKK